MFPTFNSNPFNPSSQLQQPNGPSSSSSTQVRGTTNPNNFCPNPNQMQMGGLVNPQFNQFPHTNTVVGANYNNPSQQMPQFNTVNPAHFMNQNGQWNMNMNPNPFFQMGIPNLGQLQQGVILQNLAFLANAQMGFMNAGGVGNHMPNPANMQLQGNLGSSQGFNSVQPMQNQKMFNQSQSQVNSVQPMQNQNMLNQPLLQVNSVQPVHNQNMFNQPQSQVNSVQPMQNQNMFNQPHSQNNPTKVTTDDNQMRGNWKKPHHNNYIGNQNHNASHNGSFKSNFHNKQNAKGNFRGHKDQRGKGHQDFSLGENQVEKKRPFVPSYTDQEIKQWREARRKNHPSKLNTEKQKLTEKVKEPETDDDSAAKLRRQQLKEILAKQAELGCEVAEIPSSYLSDTEQKRAFTKKERFKNKYNNKRGKNRQKRKHEQNEEIPNKKQFIKKKEPTLLQKLLSADVKRDEKHLLQVFNFMVINSFFKDSPEKPLKFPRVVVKGSGNEDQKLNVDDQEEEEEGEIIE